MSAHAERWIIAGDYKINTSCLSNDGSRNSSTTRLDSNANAGADGGSRNDSKPPVHDPELVRVQQLARRHQAKVC